MEAPIISAVTHDTSEAKVTITGVPDKPGIAAKLFRALADESVNVDMIVQNTSIGGATDISFTVPKADLAASERVTGALVAEIGASGVTHDENIGRVSLVGVGNSTASPSNVSADALSATLRTCSSNSATPARPAPEVAW